MSSRPRTGVREVIESLFATAQTQATVAATALLFAVSAGLYVTPDEGFDAEQDLAGYEEQPMEMHSFKTGPDVAKAFLKA